MSASGQHADFHGRNFPFCGTMKWQLSQGNDHAVFELRSPSRNQLFRLAFVGKVPHIAARKLAPVSRLKSNKTNSKELLGQPSFCRVGTGLALSNFDFGRIRLKDMR